MKNRRMKGNILIILIYFYRDFLRLSLLTFHQECWNFRISTYPSAYIPLLNAQPRNMCRKTSPNETLGDTLRRYRNIVVNNDNHIDGLYL